MKSIVNTDIFLAHCRCCMQSRFGNQGERNRCTTGNSLRRSCWCFLVFFNSIKPVILLIAENGVCIWLESECTLLLHHLKTNARPCWFTRTLLLNVLDCKSGWKVRSQLLVAALHSSCVLPGPSVTAGCVLWWCRGKWVYRPSLKRLLLEMTKRYLYQVLSLSNKWENT